MGFRGRLIRVESGFLELTMAEIVPEAGCELLCGHLGSPLSFLNVSNPPSTLLLSFYRGMASDFKDSLCLPLRVLAFLPLTRFFHQRPTVILRYLYPDALAQDLEGPTLPKWLHIFSPSPVWDCNISSIFYLFHLFKF